MSPISLRVESPDSTRRSGGRSDIPHNPLIAHTDAANSIQSTSSPTLQHTTTSSSTHHPSTPFTQQSPAHTTHPSLPNKLPLTTRFTFLNVRGFPSSPNHPKNQELRVFMETTQTDVFAMSEMNLDWRAISSTARLSPRTKEWFESRHAVTAHNTTENMDTTKQPGGVGLLSRDTMSYRVASTGQDPWGLGRWTWTWFRGRGNIHLRVVSCYRPVANAYGVLSVYNQQQRHFLRQGLSECPRHLFLTHLAQAIHEWQTLNDLLIIGGDWNEDTSSTNWQRYWDDLGLLSPFQGQHQTWSTFARGNNQLDNIYISPALQPLQLGMIVPSDTFDRADHSAMWIDVEHEILGFTTIPGSIAHARRLKTQDPRCKDRYNNLYRDFCAKHKLVQRADSLLLQLENMPMTPAQISEFEHIDHLRVVGMQMAERQCRKIKAGQVSWTPDYSLCLAHIRAWKLLLRKRSARKVSARLLRRSFQKIGMATIPMADQLTILTKLQEAFQWYRQLKNTSVQQRETFLERLSKAQAEASNRPQEKILKELRTREHQRTLFRNIRRIIHPEQHGRGLTMVIDTSGQECSTQTTIEDACLEENKQQFQQAHDTPLYQEPMFSLLGPLGDTTTASTILEGNGAHLTVEPDLQSTLEALSRTTAPLPATMAITEAKYAAIWSSARESTSSSNHANLHFGHYIALSTDPVLCRFHTAMVNISLRSGYSPQRWRTGINVMLQKKPGDFSVANLRTILLYDAEFNAVLKWLGQLIMHQAETSGAIALEQYGSRKGLSAITHCLNIQLTHDIIRQNKIPAAICSNDAKACYDRIVHSFASLALQRLGIPIGPIKVMFGTLQQLRHHIRTAHGDSTRFFSGNTSGLPFHGVGQGNGAGPQIWAAVSSPLCDSIRNAGLGAYIESPLTKIGTHFAGYGFVDDVDLVAATNVETLTGNQITGRLQATVNQWESRLCISGGALSAAKSRWTLVDFKWKNGKATYKAIQESPATLTIQDVSGQRTLLQRLEAWEAERSLGVRLAPSGTMQFEYKFCLQAAKIWADQVKHSKISKIAQWTNFQTVALKRLEYPLPATTFSRVECDRLMQPILSALLPALRIHSKFPRALVFRHPNHHGLAVPHLYDTQGYFHIQALLQHGTATTLTGHLIRTSYETLQLELGLPNEILQYDSTTWGPLATESWLTHTWAYLQEVGLSIKTTMPPLPSRCPNDQFLMYAFWQKGYHGQQLLTLNRCCLRLRVLTLADISNGTGMHIIPRHLENKEPTSLSSQYHWPNQGPLPDSAWITWSTSLRETFLQTTTAAISPRLGPWYTTDSQWYWLPRTDTLAQRLPAGWQYWKATRRYQILGATFQRIPDQYQGTHSDAEPAIVEHRGSTVIFWGARPLEPLPPPRRFDFISTVLNDEAASWAFKSFQTQDNGKAVAATIRDGTCIAVSDGSYKDNLGTAAWTIGSITATSWIEGRTWIPGSAKDQCSARSELGGLYSLVRLVGIITKYYQINSGGVTIGCDGLGPLHRCFKHEWDPSPSTPHYDLIKAIRVMARSTAISWRWIHIKGHQDVKSDSDLDHWAQLNIEMDKAAKIEWDNRLLRDPQPINASIPGEGWAVYIGTVKASSWSKPIFNSHVQ